MFEKFLNILTFVLDDLIFLKKDKSFIQKMWINNYFLHLMHVRDTCFTKYLELKTQQKT